MHFALLFLVVIALIFGPQWWVRRVLAQYSKPQPHFPGTGGELARHLLNQCGLQNVGVESTTAGDHYDPVARCVRLQPENINGKSLTAIATAAHEVGHAIQDHAGYPPLRARTRLVKVAQHAEKIGSVAMLAIPVVALAARAPSAGLLMFLIGLVSIGMSSLVHLFTLPTEWDASFTRALPLLKGGRYISANEERHVRRILRACAFTYVASSLAGLLNMARWIAVLRR